MCKPWHTKEAGKKSIASHRHISYFFICVSLYFNNGVFYTPKCSSNSAREYSLFRIPSDGFRRANCRCDRVQHHLRDSMHVHIFEVLGHINISGHWHPYWMMIGDDNDGQMIFGDLVGLKLPDICLTGEEKPQKNLTQETCPDQRLKPGPLHDRHACYRSSHSGGFEILWG